MKKLLYAYERKINLISIIVVEIILGFGFIGNFAQVVTKPTLETWVTAFIIAAIMAYGATSIYKVLLRRKKDQMIKEQGVEVKGTIENPIVKRSNKSEKSTIIGYFLKIKIKHPLSKKEVTFITPELDFNPYKELGSKECSVYVLEEEVYATNFTPATKIEDAIWKDEEPQGRKKIKWLQPLVIVMFIFLTLGFILLCFK